MPTGRLWRSGEAAVDIEGQGPPSPPVWLSRRSRRAERRANVSRSPAPDARISRISPCTLGECVSLGRLGRSAALLALQAPGRSTRSSPGRCACPGTPDSLSSRTGRRPQVKEVVRCLAARIPNASTRRIAPAPFGALIGEGELPDQAEHLIARWELKAAQDGLERDGRYLEAGRACIATERCRR
jgi:hypothetical protein